MPYTELSPERIWPKAPNPIRCIGWKLENISNAVRQMTTLLLSDNNSFRSLFLVKIVKSNSILLINFVKSIIQKANGIRNINTKIGMSSFLPKFCRQKIIKIVKIIAKIVVLVFVPRIMKIEKNR